MATTTATRDGLWLVPEDLCPAAVKLARRVQALRDGRIYAILLVKMGDGWAITVEDKGKAERVG